MIRTDDPIYSPDEDLLGRNRLALEISDVISHLDNYSKSFVFGIEGEWGVGKTSFINLIKEDLKQYSNIEIMNFNPWMIQNQNLILVDFFNQFSSTFFPKNNSIKDTIKRYSKSITGASVGVNLFGLLTLSFNIGGTPIAELKEKINKEIKKNINKESKKFIVIIDDIDRLDKTEVKTIFTLVKNIADFPNTIFILSYDRKLVQEYLTDADNRVQGSEYLKKIIKTSFTLPEPSKEEVREIFYKGVNEILRTYFKSDDLNEYEQEHWNKLNLHNILEPLINLRDVNRFLNSFYVALSTASRGDINKIDFIAIEIFRVFYVEVYMKLARKKEFLTGRRTSGLYSRNNEQQYIDETLNEILSSVEEGKNKEHIKEILKEIFKPLENGFNHSDWRNEWLKQKRVCSFDKFDFYFRLGVPYGSTSIEELQEIKLASNSFKKIGELLSELIINKRIRSQLEQLHTIQNEFSYKQSKNLIKALWIAEKVLDTEESISLFGDYGLLISRITGDAIKSIIPNDRDKFIREILKSSSNLYLEFRLYQSLMKDLKEESGITEKLSKDVLNDFLEKIKKEAGNKKLQKRNKFLFLLYRWNQLGSAEEVYSYLEELTQNREGVFDFLKGLKSKVYSTAGDYHQIKKEDVVNLYDVEKFDEKINSLDLNKMNEEEKILVKLYQKQLDEFGDPIQ